MWRHKLRRNSTARHKASPHCHPRDLAYHCLILAYLTSTPTPAWSLLTSTRGGSVVLFSFSHCFRFGKHPTLRENPLSVKSGYCSPLFLFRKWSWRRDLSQGIPPPLRARRPLWLHLLPRHLSLLLGRETPCPQPLPILAPRAVVAPAVEP